MTTAIDMTKPALADTYTAWQSEIVNALQGAGAMYDTTYWTLTSPPTGTKRFNAANSLIEINSGTPASPSWTSALAYLQTANSGSQAVAGTVNFSGTLQYGGNAVATQAWVTSQSYETTSALSATLASYATTASLASASVSYATTSGTASACSGNAATATTATSASNLTGASPNLGSNWQVDANGQMHNNALTKFIAAYYASATTGSGTTVAFDTLVAQQGSNFSIASHAITIAAAGLYEVEATFQIAYTSAATINYYFAGTANTIYGPTSSKPLQVTLNSTTAALQTVTIKAYIKTTAANQTINVTSSSTFLSGTLTASAGAQIAISCVG